MKTNGNDQRSLPYYIGIDAGTDSVGWAVTDPEYHIKKWKGQSMWGIRLFEEANDASERRTARTNRRRLNRRKQRLFWLDMLFAPEITKVDPLFFDRKKCSALLPEDKSPALGKFTLLATDAESRTLVKTYPTVYHLRNALMESDVAQDVRLVYLAIHHIMKSRGHFLLNVDGNGDENLTLSSALDRFLLFLQDSYGVQPKIEDRPSFEAILRDGRMGKTDKKKEIRKLVQFDDVEEPEVDLGIAFDALSGYAVKLSELFFAPELKGCEKPSLSLEEDLDAYFDSLSVTLGDRVDLLVELKALFDAAKLSVILGNFAFISQAKVAQYEKNRRDLRSLKQFIKREVPALYNEVFRAHREKLNNYSAYSDYGHVSGAYTCNQEDFCKFLKSKLPADRAKECIPDLYEAIQKNTFLPKLRSSENGVIPNQLHRKELVRILENASHYLPFLLETDGNGMSVKEKILSIFDFRIPYYVGPLNPSSPRAWIERSENTIYPWNFGAEVDTKKSAQSFILRLIGKCTYTGEDTLPKDSLVYSEFTVLNEINNLKVDGYPIPVAVKEEIFQSLFVNSERKVTKKTLKDWLVSHGYMQRGQEISGVDEVIKSKLKSLHDMQRFLEKGATVDEVEDVIRLIVIFGEDKRMLRSVLREKYAFLEDADLSYLCRLKYKDWGRLSRTLLLDLYHPDPETGEAMSILTALHRTNENLMRLLSEEYSYGSQAKALLKANLGTDRVEALLDNMYISPKVRRSIRQTLKIVDELVDTQHGAPEKIFIEVARGEDLEKRDPRTKSRKEQLLELYKNCKTEVGDLYDRLENEDESRLRSEKLFLYYTQLGRCMYTGEPINLDDLLNPGNQTYDRDHIFPRSRIKDDSIHNNLVLVKSTENREKTNEYPIKASIREKMLPFWKSLKDKGLITEQKYNRLVRSTPLSEEELASFVQRQLVETQQATKALASVLGKLYPNTKIVYSKARNVSEFRQQFDLVKCREVNDLHHAKDAYLNVVVGNVYHTKFTSRFFDNILHENYSLNTVFQENTKGAWNMKTSIGLVKAQYAKNNILFTRMPHEQSGAFFDLTIMPRGKGQMSVKQGLDVEKYGGYNKVSGAYFFVVEHTDKKGRIRTIEPVYLFKKSLYESDPLRYCEEVLGLKDPKVICKAILLDALLQVDGKLLYVTGRTGNNLVCKHKYQLVLDAEKEKYVKEIGKYLERCRVEKNSIPITDKDLISAKGNLLLYDFFIDKLKQPVYNRLFSSTVLKQVEGGRNTFLELPISEQCDVLWQILKSFKCDRQTSDLTGIKGKGQAGVLSISKKVSSAKSAVLWHESVTGLYRHPENLLK